MVAMWSTLLASVVVGVVSTDVPDNSHYYTQLDSAIQDPTSIVNSQPGSGYANPAQAVTNTFNNGATAAQQLAPRSAVASTAAAGATTFDPNAIAANPNGQYGANRATDVTKAMNAIVSGDDDALKAASAAAIRETPEAAAEWLEGFVDGYFDKVVLQQGEKECIVTSLKTMTKDGVSLLSELIQTIEALIAKKNPDYMMLMAGAAQVVEVGTTGAGFEKKCIRADVAAVMTATFDHLKDPVYVKARMLSNGLDITKLIAKSIPDANEANFLAVGKDFGRLMRDVLLSENTEEVKMVLPAGMTPNEVGPAVVEGILQGMFVENTRVQITSKVDPLIDIEVDLHECVAEEAEEVAIAMNAMYVAVAELSTQINKLKLASKGITTGMGQPNVDPSTNQAAINQQPQMSTNAANQAWMTDLSGLMTNIPTMLVRCGITDQQRTMMSKAMKDIHNLKMSFTIPGPGDKIKAGAEAAERLESATQYWKIGKYNMFGEMTGGLLRDLVLTMFPSHAKVVAPYPQQPALYSDSWKMGHLGQANQASGSFALYVGGFAAVMLLGLSLIRVRTQNAGERPETRLLSKEDVEAVE